MLDVEEVVGTGAIKGYCPRHPGVEPVWIKDKRLFAGGYWRCQRCNAEAGKRSGEKLIHVGEFVVMRRKVHKWYVHYRLRPEDVLDLYEAQDRRCMFGGEPLAWEDIQVEHKHGDPRCRKTKSRAETGCPKEAVRGLSCNHHNLLEGYYITDPESYLAVVRWHVEHNGGKWSELCSGEDEGVTSASR